MAPGPSGVPETDPLPNLHPDRRRRLNELPLRPDAWTSYGQARDSYYTTEDMAKRLSKWVRERPDLKITQPSYNTVAKWCKRDWFGELPEGRSGRGLGYRIPPSYEYLGRLWLLTSDPKIRATAIATFTEPDTEPKPWFLVVASSGSLHYTAASVLHQFEILIRLGQAFTQPVHVFYLGDENGALRE